MFDITGALCLNYDPSWWDSEHGIVPYEVVAICARCPISETCLDWAIRNNEYGIWAGLTKNQRDALKRGRVRATCPACNANRLWNEQEDQTCVFCGMSWNVRRKTAEPAR